MIRFMVYQKKNFDLVSKALKSIPRMCEMVTKSRCELKKLMDKHHRLSYPLLQWQVIPFVPVMPWQHSWQITTKLTL